MKKDVYICITESLCNAAEIKHNIVSQVYFHKSKKMNFQKNLYLLLHLIFMSIPKVCVITPSL